MYGDGTDSKLVKIVNKLNSTFTLSEMIILWYSSLHDFHIMSPI